MSARKNILDAIVTALEGISGIGLVSTALKGYHECAPNELPALFPIDADTKVEYIAFPHPTAHDKQADMEIIVTGYVFNKYNSTDTGRTNLIANVETALESDASLKTLITDINLQDIKTDKGLVKNYSIFDMTFMVVYQYNHNTP